LDDGIGQSACGFGDFSETELDLMAVGETAFECGETFVDGGFEGLQFGLDMTGEALVAGIEMVFDRGFPGFQPSAEFLLKLLEGGALIGHDARRRDLLDLLGETLDFLALEVVPAFELIAGVIAEPGNAVLERFDPCFGHQDAFIQMRMYGCGSVGRFKACDTLLKSLEVAAHDDFANPLDRLRSVQW